MISVTNHLIKTAIFTCRGLTALMTSKQCLQASDSSYPQTKLISLQILSFFSVIYTRKRYYHSIVHSLYKFIRKYLPPCTRHCFKTLECSKWSKASLLSSANKQIKTLDTIDELMKQLLRKRKQCWIESERIILERMVRKGFLMS